MERNKHGMGPSKRGGKAKSMAPLHGDLIALGAKGGSRLEMEAKHQQAAQMKPGNILLAKPEKKMEAGTSGMLKKPKPQLSMASAGRSTGDRQVARPAEMEAWQSVAVDLPPSTDLVSAVAEADFLRAEALICGAVRQLHAQRAKPDPGLSLSLLLLAKTQPAVFCSETALAAVCWLLRRDAAASFKSKGNPQVQVLAANVLYSVFRDENHWKEIFVRVYLDDAAGDRLWVDSEECKPFVENVVTAFGTRVSPKSMLQPDITLGARPDCPSPPGASSSSSAPGMDDDDSTGFSIVLDEKSGHTVTPRYETQQERIRTLVLDAVKEYIGPRKQPIETVTRNILRLLASVCGIPEVRQRVVSRLEVWLQSPKWSRPAQELLVSLCTNLTSHTQFDTDVISQLVRFRLKAKPIINLYLNCMRELLAAHPDNMTTLLKHTIYNELSVTRNPHNMAVLGAVFQHSAQQAAAILAEVFLELLMNKDDYLRALRPLWREICRSLRYEVDFYKFCSGLFQDRKDAAFRELEFRERYVTSVCDLVALSILLAITPAVKEAASCRPGEKPDTAPLTAYQALVSQIQRDAIVWLHVAVPDMTAKNWAEFPHCVYKVLFLEPAESYHKHDNWPTENERALMIRVASDAPVLQDTLLRVLLIGFSKTLAMSAANALEVAENLVRRSAQCHLQTETATLQLDKLEIVDLLFNLTVYQQPEHMSLPEGYVPPQLAIQERYWRVWVILLIVCAHNPATFGKMAWEHYDTLKMLMEMCITNSFRFPPPTMASGERADEARTKELQIVAIERRQILEYESHLAAASTGETITETNSLLLSQLISLDPTGPCRRPPSPVLEQLAQLNSSLRLGQLLCTSRDPDFLLDILHRQGPNQSMPWLSDLVQNNEGAFSVLPVQCLCEFLLTQSVGAVDDGGGAVRPPTQAKHQELLSHLQRLVRHPSHDQRANVELVEYFLRRLSSQQRQARLQAAKGFELVLLPPEPTSPESQEPYAWLLRHLPAVPNFHHLRQGAIHGLRIACHYETEPGLVGAYVQFLAAHGSSDPLPELTETVVDLAQLVVERSTIVAALLPSEPRAPPAAQLCLRALLHIFNTYMQQVGEPEGVYSWAESADLVLVRWPSGRTAAINTLVVHAVVILLTYHPGPDCELFDQLMDIWFPAAGPAPRTLDSTPLYPDWLKLRMVRSTAPRLVDAALAGLEPAQLVLFIQSFGVPVASMTKLLMALDAAVSADPAAVAGAVMNKEYMAQLVEVQHQRGAKGGHEFAAIIDADAEKKSPEVVLEPPAPARPSPVAISRPVTALAPSQVLWFVRELFSDQSETTHQDQLRSLQRCISMEAREKGRLVTKATIGALLQLLSEAGGSAFLGQLHSRPTAACCLLRLLTAVVRPDSPLSADLLAVCETIAARSPSPPGPLVTICQSYRRQQRRAPAAVGRPAAAALTERQLADLICGTAAARMECTVRRLVDECMATERTPHLVAAISRCLLQHSSPAAAAAAAAAAGSGDQATVKVKVEEPSETGQLTQGQVGLLVDWLELLEPEIISSCPDIQRQMLFARRSQSERSGQLSNRAYLLALLTHQASWGTLHTTIDVLLGDQSDRYDPTTVLDFLWACLYVPRLWQGMDKSVSPRQESTEVLCLSESQLTNLVRYVVSEMGDSDGADVRCRMPLLLRCCRRRPALVAAAVSHLKTARSGGGPVAAPAERLLLELYLQLPHIIAQLSDDSEFLQSALIEGGVSVLDSLSHTLLTAIGATRPGKEWINNMKDFEISLRKMAATHPVLFLRQLPMVASLLRGRTHLDGPVFRQRNHAVLFSQLLGVLELLQPHVYLSQHRPALVDILDSYCHMLQRHNLKEVSAMVPRIAVILNNFLSHAANEASQFLNKYSDLISSLAARFHDQPLLRTLASCLTSGGGGGGAGSGPLPVGPDQGPSAAQLSGLMMKLNSAESSDELTAVLQDLEALASRRVGVLDQFVDDLCDLLSSSGASVRQLAHELLLRHLRQTPTAADRCVSAYFECLDSGDECVRAMVLDRLPEIVVLAQEYASQLLQKAFDVAISTNVNTASYISDAMALLNVQTGA